MSFFDLAEKTPIKCFVLESYWNGSDTPVAAAQFKNICPEWLNWPGSLAWLSLKGLNEFQNKKY